MHRGDGAGEPRPVRRFPESRIRRSSEIKLSRELSAAVLAADAILMALRLGSHAAAEPIRPASKQPHEPLHAINPAVHLKSDDAGSRDKKDEKDETPAGTVPETNSVLFVPESDETEIKVSADDPVDDYEFHFASDGVPF